MRKYPLANKGLSGYYRDSLSALAGAGKTGNFGRWCLYDANRFCQEREGCENCAAGQRFKTG